MGLVAIIIYTLGFIVPPLFAGRGYLGWDGKSHYVDFLNALQFEDTVRDTPLELRPHTFMTFYNDTCLEEMTQLGVVNTAATFHRTHLLTGIYHYAKQNTLGWYHFYDDMNLPKTLGVESDMLRGKCPILTVIPNTYDRDNRDVKPVVWDGSGDWRVWLKEALRNEVPESFYNEGSWSNHRLRERDYTEARTHLMVATMPPNVPHFTPTGWKVIKMEPEFIKALKDFYAKYESKRIDEQWHDLSTQINFHETKTTLVYLDNNPHERNRIANTFVKPLLEEWCNCKLYMKAFYGIREYYRGAELRQHIDRVDTHVISAAMHMWAEGLDKPWPFEVIDFSGKRQVLQVEPWTIIFYESSVLPHGRMQTVLADKYVNCFAHFAPTNWPYSLKNGHVLDGPMGKIVLGDATGILNRQHHLTLKTDITDPDYVPWKVGDGPNAEKYQNRNVQREPDTDKYKTEQHPAHEL